MTRRKMLKNSGFIGTGSLLMSEERFKEAYRKGNQIGKTHLFEVIVEFDGLSGVNYTESDGRTLYRTDDERLLVSKHAPEILKGSWASISPQGKVSASTIFESKPTESIVIDSEFARAVEKRVELAEPVKMPQLEITRQGQEKVEVNINSSNTSVNALSEHRYELPKKEVQVRTGFKDSQSFEATPIVRMRNHGQLTTVETEVFDQ